MEGTGANEANELNGASKLEWGQEVMRAVGMAGKMGKAGKTQPAEQNNCRQTQPADSPSGTGLEEQTAHSWPALQQQQQLQTRMADLSPCRKVGGVQ